MFKHIKPENEHTSEKLLSEKGDKFTDDELSSFSDVSSGAELSSVTTDEFDRETIGSITTESDSRNVKKLKLPLIEEKAVEISKIPNEVSCVKVSSVEPASTDTPQQYRSINVKCNAPPKKSASNELADLVKRLTGNDFTNTTTTHPSRQNTSRPNWVAESKSSDDPGTSDEPVSDPSETKEVPNDPSPPKPILTFQDPVNEISQPAEPAEPMIIPTPMMLVHTAPVIVLVPAVTSPVCDDIPGPSLRNITQSNSFQKSLEETKSKPTGFRPVRRPVIRNVSDVSMTSESESESLNRPPRSSLPIPRNYRDIVMSKLAQRNSGGKPIPTDVEHRPEEVLSDGNQNTSDDAESIPISYRVEQENRKRKILERQTDLDRQTDFEKTETPDLSTSPLETVTEHDTGPSTITEKSLTPLIASPNIITSIETEEISEVSEVPHEELKKNLSNHQKVPTKARKPLVRKVSANIQPNIPEEKSESSTCSSNNELGNVNENPTAQQKENVPDVPEKKKRRNKKSRSKEDLSNPTLELTQEEKELQMKREYDEFVKKQKEAEKSIKDEKARKKKLKKSKKIEPVRVTNIFDSMADPDQISSGSSLNDMTIEERRRMSRKNQYTVRLINREVGFLYFFLLTDRIFRLKALKIIRTFRANY